MIQRIQTVYFLIALILISLSLFGLPLYEVKLDKLGTMVAHVSAYKAEIEQMGSQSTLLWMYIAFPALTVVLSIFLFKDRKKQATMAKLAAGLTLFSSAWIFYTSTQFMAKTNGFMANNGTVPQLAWYCFVGSIVFILLGLRGVNKDKKLIDSLNRLR